MNPGVCPQRRVFLHRSLQLASVLFAAASTGGVCARVFHSTGSPACWGLVRPLHSVLITVQERPWDMGTSA